MKEIDKVYHFDAVINSVEGIDGAYVEFPYDVKQEFGTGGRVKVIATFDGVEYRGILVKMKTPCHIIGITKAIREQIGKQPGDTISVTVRPDDENKISAMPESLRSALSENKEAAAFFDQLTVSQKNKFIDFISSAKKQETADSRLIKVMQMLVEKEKMK